MYLITTFPSLNIKIDEYQAVKKYLLSFGKERLEQSGKKGARKKTNNKWFETQDTIAYWEDFYKPKIVWKAVGKNLGFALLEEGKFLSAPASFITSQDNLYILGVLCSAYAKHFIYNNSDTTGAGDIMLNIQSLKKLPLPQLPEKNKTCFVEKVKEILFRKNKNIETLSLEKELDGILYEGFQFTKEEIVFIEIK